MRLLLDYQIHQELRKQTESEITTEVKMLMSCDSCWGQTHAHTTSCNIPGISLKIDVPSKIEFHPSNLNLYLLLNDSLNREQKILMSY